MYISVGILLHALFIPAGAKTIYPNGRMDEAQPPFHCGNDRSPLPRTIVWGIMTHDLGGSHAVHAAAISRDAVFPTMWLALYERLRTNTARPKVLSRKFGIILRNR